MIKEFVKTCACGTTMSNFLKGPGKQVYVCHHCDQPCAGVASTANCPLCRAIAIKR